jgi:streptogrisin C
MRWKKSLLAVSAAAIVVAGVSGASTYAATDSDAKSTPERASGDADVIEALQRDLGLTKAQAERLGKLQAQALELDGQLQEELGSRFAGSVFDAETGRLTVKVTNRSAARHARANGAAAQLVDRSLGELRKVQRGLDRSAGVTSERGRTAKADPSSNALQSWYVDEATNTVVVEAKQGKMNQARKAVRKYGDAVSLVEAEVEVVQHDSWWDGGDHFGTSPSNWANWCSAGFNVRNNSTGARYMITAGHCVNSGSYVYGHNDNGPGNPGRYFGHTLESWYTAGIDDAIVRGTSSTWTQGPWVDTNPYHGGVISINGVSRAPVGAAICKSGMTTKWTCGSIVAHNVSVTYSSGQTLYGLNQHTACTRPGDSGGAYVNNSSGWKAEGIHSGGNGRSVACSSSSYRSYYTPMQTAMNYYGPKYGVTIW